MEPSLRYEKSMDVHAATGGDRIAQVKILLCSNTESACYNTYAEPLSEFLFAPDANLVAIAGSRWPMFRGSMRCAAPGSLALQTPERMKSSSMNKTGK